MSWIRRRRRPEDNPEVKAAMEARDEVLDEADAAIREVDRVQKEVRDEMVAEYAAAEAQRVKNGRRGKH